MRQRYDQRYDALIRQTERLGRRIDHLQSLDRRFSWYRLAVIVAGMFTIWLVSLTQNSRLVWFAIAVSVIVFVLVTFYHRRLDQWREKFRLWRNIKSTQLARMRMDWDNIPLPALDNQPSRPSLNADLDITGSASLHHLMDTAVSFEGSKRLANWLTQRRHKPETILQRQNLVKELVPQHRFRERLLLDFHMVSREQLDGKNLLNWLQIQGFNRELNWLLPLSWLLAAINLILFGLSIFAGLPSYWIFSLTGYAILYFAYQSKISPLIESVAYLDSELDKFRVLIYNLESHSYRQSPHLKTLCSPFIQSNNLPSKQLRKIKRATAAIGLRMNPVVWVLLNIFVPWDISFAFLIQRYQKEMAKNLPFWLDIWFELEALISLANFSYLNPEYTYPGILPLEGGSNQPIFQAEALGHPLISYEQKISNDFRLDRLGEVIVVTGSNMAGKSTFIKTVGINLCLAFSGGPVNAKSFKTIPFKLHSCIRISDSITDGYSYFYSEVKCLKALLDLLASDDRCPVLYLIDEIFKGTNNRERLIGSQAYVHALTGLRGVGLLATHDLELAKLADINEHVINYHFRDEVVEGKLVFDYKLRNGSCPTTNALKIMRLEGLPVDV
jgi:hypothetical protein